MFFCWRLNIHVIRLHICSFTNVYVYYKYTSSLGSWIWRMGSTFLFKFG